MIKLNKSKIKKNYTDPEEPRHVALDKVSSISSNSETLKVISYNIKFSKKIDKAIKLLSENDQLVGADIICLQEMDHAGVERIANTLHYNYVYYPAVLHPKYGRDFGNAILSKWPIISDKKIILPQTNEDRLQRIAVSTTVSINDREITIICIHMEVFLGAQKRNSQIENLIKMISPLAKQCVIAGDFNTFTKKNRRAILNSFVDAGFKLATEEVGWTFKHWYLLNKKNYLDHIYTKGLQIVNKGKVINRKPSDHLPIWVELK